MIHQLNILLCIAQFQNTIWGGRLSLLSHLEETKIKIANSTVDIWWCPWDKGGAVIYVIGGTHPPIWLAIDINHHQISNGHAFPSAIKCSPAPKSPSHPCVSERSSWFWEADERQFVQTRAPREAEGRRQQVAASRQWRAANLKWALSSWKQRSCHTTWEWCENQRRKKLTRVILYFWGGSPVALFW